MTPEKHVDYPILKKTSLLMEERVAQVNEQKRLIDDAEEKNFEKLKEIQDKIKVIIHELSVCAIVTRLHL